VDDGIETRIEVISTLPKERMQELLAAELVKRGFELENGKASRTNPDGVVVSVDTATGVVSITAKAEKQIDAECTEVVHGDTDDITIEQENTEKAKGHLQEALKGAIAAKKEALRQETTKKLEAVLGDLKQELDDISTRVSGEALKERARQLGTVEEIVEGQDGSMTIKVRL
jgi:molecular chaperone DnaK (HSP70)